LWIATVSLRMVFFCYNFFQIIFFNFIFFNIELFVNYNYMSLQIRLNHVGKHYSFHYKTLWIVTVFLTWFVFPFFGVCFVIFFSKIVYVDFFFNIKLIGNLALYFFSLKHCELLQCFSMWFFYDFFQNYLCQCFFEYLVG